MNNTHHARAVVIAWSELPVESVLPGIERQIFQGHEQTVVRYVYDSGSVFPMHAHPQEQMTMVVRGRITFQIDDSSGVSPREIELGPGQIAVLPGNVSHGARVIGSEDVETVNTLSPRRADGPVFDDHGQGQ